MRIKFKFQRNIYMSRLCPLLINMGSTDSLKRPKTFNSDQKIK